MAVILFNTRSDYVSLCCGFESEGGVMLSGSTIAGDLNCSGGRFINPGHDALTAHRANIEGNVILSPQSYGFGGAGFYADGKVDFVSARIGANLAVENATFTGKPGEQHGFEAAGVSVSGALVWHNVKLENGAVLDLTIVSATALVDDAGSWPGGGKLLLDGFNYQRFITVPAYDTPHDARSRLKWLALQPGFSPAALSSARKGLGRERR